MMTGKSKGKLVGGFLCKAAPLLVTVGYQEGYKTEEGPVRIQTEVQFLMTESLRFLVSGAQWGGLATPAVASTC